MKSNRYTSAITVYQFSLQFWFKKIEEIIYIYKKTSESLMNYFNFNQRTPEVLVWLANTLLKRDGHNQVNRR